MTDTCATPGLLSLKQALVQILDNLPENNAYERLSLKNSLNRILYTDITSALNIPSFRNSSMDGYALNAQKQQNGAITVIGTSWAGKPFTGPVGEGECVRIFTGGYVPDDCDSVVMQENVLRTEETIQVSAWPKHEENIRNIADDTHKGQTLLTKGKRLTPADIGLLASCGIADVPVYRKIIVAYFSTGDELVSIGQQLKLGQIFDSNRYTLHALLNEAGVIPIDLGVIPDNPTAVEAALLSASEQCDVIITSGGVSVGEADFITDVLEKIGRVNLWKIAIKPGKPLVFGHINKAAFFGLPGNPVSVMVTFQQIVAPALEKMMGNRKPAQPIILKARTTETIIKQPGRKEFQRGFVESIHGELIVHSTGGQGSHMLSSMSKANCLIVLEQSSGSIKKGQYVNIQLLGKSI